MSGLRIASWIVVACALACALGVFAPAFELRVGGRVVSKRQAISLHQVASDRELVRKLLAAYRGSKAGRVGGKIVSAVTPRTGGRLRGVLEDAGDAMDTLSGISEDDVRTYGRLFAIVLWGLIALDALMAAFAFVGVVRGSYRRAPLVACVVLSVVVTAITVGILWGCKEVAFEANDEIGTSAIGLGSAPYLMLLAAAGAMCAAIVALVLHIRAGRDDTVEDRGQRAR